MKKRILSLVLALALLIAVMPYVAPVTAQAACSHSSLLDFTKSSPPTCAKGCWMWKNKTLTLSNLNLTVKNSNAILLPKGDVTLILNGDSVINGGGKSAILSPGDIPYNVDCVIACQGNLTIRGDGSVTVTGDNSRTHLSGIYADGNITINSGTLIATGSDNYSSSLAHGIVSRKGGDIIINGGTVIATGGGGNAGISALGDGCDVIINGGNVTATSEEAKDITKISGTNGIISSDNIIINGGTINVTGSVRGSDNVTIDGGNVTVTGYMHSLKVIISGGTVDIKGYISSYRKIDDVYVGNLTISGGSGVVQAGMGAAIQVVSLTVDPSVTVRGVNGEIPTIGKTTDPFAGYIQTFSYNDKPLAGITFSTDGKTPTPAPEPSPPPSPTPNPLDTASSWARERLTETLKKGFVPADLQDNYQNTITRAEFCRMAVKWVEYKTGKKIDAVLADKGVARDQNAFTDTKDPDILAAFALGITSGVGNNKFNPSGSFNRESAAGMILNVGKVIGLNTSNPPPSGFTDMGDVAEWCVDGVNFCFANKIMTGDNNKFNPKLPYTREQSILTFNNIP